MQEFKAGDKVKLVSHDIIGWEESQWTKDAGLEFEKEYEIFMVDYSVPDMPCVFILEDCIYGRPGFAFHPEHFEYA